MSIDFRTIAADLYCRDWIWPAIRMFPVNETYGTWPMSGEITLMEARGNNETYKAQCVLFI